MTAVFVVMVMLNGVPQPGNMKFTPVMPDCASEMAIIKGINQAESAAGQKIQFVGKCVVE